MGPVGEVNLEELSSCTALSLLGSGFQPGCPAPSAADADNLVRSIFSFPLRRNQLVFMFYQNTLTQSQACDFGFVFLAASRVDFSNDNFGYTRLCCGVFLFQEMLCANAGNVPGLTRHCLSILCATVAQIMVGSSQKSNCSKSGHCWGSHSLGQLQKLSTSSVLMFVMKWAKKRLKDRTEALTQLSNI